MIDSTEFIAIVIENFLYENILKLYIDVISGEEILRNAEGII